MRKLKKVKRLTVLAILMVWAALAAFGRVLEVHDIKTLVADCKLVFVGRVKSVKASGISTSLSYPTWKGVVFEWLQVEVEVLEPVKGTQKGHIVQTALLSVDESKGPAPMADAPGMLEPKRGDLFLFFLLPTIKTNLFAAFTAPWDDDQAIFHLVRGRWEYNSYREGKEQSDSPFYDRHKVVWNLVDDKGDLIPAGGEWMRRTYAKEIGMGPSNRVIYLRWQKYTNPAGWSHDVPMETGHETNAGR
jgi:hypothetical protein